MTEIGPDTFVRLGIALGLGLLVGLQRERAAPDLAGIRTFPLITMLGFVAVILSEGHGPWTLAAALLGLASLVVAGNLAKAREGDDVSLTTEVAVLLMFAVGALLGLGYISLPVVVGGTAGALLHWKTPLHTMAKRADAADLGAVFRLVLIGLVILPALPDRTFGPYDVLNPFRIWLVVVLVVGISLCAYVAERLLGGRRGLLVAGLLGGLISSTATTVANARVSKTRPGAVPGAYLVILLASTFVYIRVLFEIGLVAPDFLRAAALPLLAMMAVNLLLAAIAFRRDHDQLEPPDRQGEPPTNMPAAIAFGLMFALVLVALAAAEERFGLSGLYTVAALSGLTDMDAITLSTAQLVRMGQLDSSDGWRAIVVGYLANMVFKTGIVGLLGPPALLRRLLAALAILMVAGIALISLGP